MHVAMVKIKNLEIVVWQRHIKVCSCSSWFLFTLCSHKLILGLYAHYDILCVIYIYIYIYVSCKCEILYSTIGGKPLLGYFTRMFTVSAISNSRDYRSSTVSTAFESNSFIHSFITSIY